MILFVSGDGTRVHSMSTGTVGILYFFFNCINVQTFYISFVLLCVFVTDRSKCHNRLIISSFFSV